METTGPARTPISRARVLQTRRRSTKRTPAGSPSAGAFASTGGARTSACSRRHPSSRETRCTSRTRSRASSRSTAETGTLKWSRLYAAPNDGPNGVAVADGRVFAATDTTAFSLDAETGHRLWSERLADSDEQFVNIAPTVHDGRVYLSTVGFAPGGRGALYALDAEHRRACLEVRHDQGALASPVRRRRRIVEPALGRRARATSMRASRTPALGAAPRGFPNGGWFRGSTLYTDSLVVLEGATGRLALVRPSATLTTCATTTSTSRRSSLDVDDPERDVVFGAGKAARVVAWDSRTHDERLWERAVGTHRNDTGPLPVTPVIVCPGLFGGVLTPMAYADGSLFVPVVELCMRESAVKSFSVFQRPPENGKGDARTRSTRATGRTALVAPLRLPLFGCATVSRDVVFAPTFDGRVRALSAQTGRRSLVGARAGRDQRLPSRAGDLLLVAAGARHRDFPRARRRADRLRALPRIDPAEIPSVGSRGPSQHLRRACWRHRARTFATAAERAVPAGIVDVRAAARQHRDGRPRQGRADQARARSARLPRARPLRGRAREPRRRCSPAPSPGSIDGAAASRVQCTPDLQPTDVTGLSVFNQQTREFEFRAGPRLRATSSSSTRSTERCRRRSPRCSRRWPSGRSRSTASRTPLPDPFLLLATENPIEQEGTFPLPEAQLDRFFLKTALGYPTVDAGDGDRPRAARSSTRSSRLRPVVSVDERARAPAAIEDVYVDRPDPALDRRARAGEPGPRGDRARRVRAREPGARARRACLGPPSRAGLRVPEDVEALFFAGPRPPDPLHADVPRRGASPRARRGARELPRAVLRARAATRARRGARASGFSAARE